MGARQSPGAGLQPRAGAGSRLDRRLQFTRWALGVAILVAVAGVPALAQIDSGVIRLAPRGSAAEPEPEQPTGAQSLDGPRRGCDYRAFEARLETLWFQRKAYLADGRDADAQRQSELIRSFCAEEGVGRLEGLSGALLAEAARYIDEGHYAKALASLELAETFDSGSSQVAMARAEVYWKSGRGHLKAARAWLSAFQRSLVESARRLTVLNHLAIVAVLALIGGLLVFSLAMLQRYQMPLRHEVEELLARRGLGAWGLAAGVGVLLLPFLVWFGAGWAAVFWIVVTFRFMRRNERWTAVALLLAAALTVPAYRLTVAAYGVVADPVVRNTLASADGVYDPTRIVKLRQLVDAHPDDAVYRFLLAGMYKNGRHFEEAYDEYKAAIQIDPTLHQGYINIGNIFYRMGQHAEAITSYRQALNVRPDSVVAYYNMHVAQSELFHFEDADESLARARAIDAKRTAAVMAASRSETERPMPVDASVELGTIWQAALEGRDPHAGAGTASGAEMAPLLSQFRNPVSLGAALALVFCAVVGVGSRRGVPARRCIRCGRPFCDRCRRGRQGREYCSQCLHLFVLGDGLAPETKTQKLYDVERHERRTRRTRKLASLLLPGAGLLLRGRAARGSLWVMAWFAALIAWQPAALRPLERLFGLDMRLEMLEIGPVPAMFRIDPLDVIAVLAAVAVWLTANIGRRRGQEA